MVERSAIDSEVDRQLTLALVLRGLHRIDKHGGLQTGVDNRRDHFVDDGREVPCVPDSASARIGAPELFSCVALGHSDCHFDVIDVLQPVY